MVKETIYKNIIDLLKYRNWTMQESSNSKFNVFLPPAELDFEPSYRLHIYNKYNNSDFVNSIAKSLEILAQIYINDDLDELGSIVIEDRQILSFHIESEHVINGKPSIPFFDTLIHRAKDLLQETANFSVLKQPHFFDNSEEAERYLNYCNFFKNDVGSLITKIQLPNNEDIKEGNLFDKAIKGNEINHNLLKVTSFINTEILNKDDFELDDDFLLTNRDYISVNISNKLKSLYSGIDYSNIEIELKGTNINEFTAANNLDKVKLNKLSAFSKTVKEKMKEISENDFYGKIVELKSKDVDSDKNIVIVEGLVKKVKKKISIPLNSSQIKLAADAFKSNKTVLINGILEKEKSQYRVIELKEFMPISK